jgi:predicted nucleotidyltransferase
MSTTINTDNIANSLFGKTRRAVLALLYSHVDERFYFRQIARILGIGLGALQRELANLSDAGLIRKTVIGRQVFYQANSECPIYIDLKNLVMKTIGVGDVLKTALASLEKRIEVAFIFGSVAKGSERLNSDIDIIVIGNVTFSEIISALSQAQKTVRREINPLVYPPEEFRLKMAENHHFLKSILKRSKYFLIGDERELERLAE